MQTSTGRIHLSLAELHQKYGSSFLSCPVRLDLLTEFSDQGSWYAYPQMSFLLVRSGHGRQYMGTRFRISRCRSKPRSTMFLAPGSVDVALVASETHINIVRCAECCLLRFLSVPFLSKNQLSAESSIDSYRSLVRKRHLSRMASI